MSTKQFITASILTAFTSVVLAGVFQHVKNPNATSAAAVPSVQSQALSEPSAERSVIDALVRDNIETHVLPATTPTPNEIVIQATQVSEAKTVGPSAATVATTASITPTASATQTAYSAQQAANIARGVAQNGDVLSTPELVRYAGKVAYEVVFAQGHVYVDSATGAVLDNGVAMANDKQHEYDEDDNDNHESHSKKRHGKKEHHGNEGEGDGDDD